MAAQQDAKQTPQTLDDGGEIQMVITGIVWRAARALKGDDHPTLALEWIYELARMAEIIWIREQFEASPSVGTDPDDSPKRGLS